jgi:hypothetical protein
MPKRRVRTVSEPELSSPSHDSHHTLDTRIVYAEPRYRYDEPRARGSTVFVKAPYSVKPGSITVHISTVGAIAIIAGVIALFSITVTVAVAYLHGRDIASPPRLDSSGAPINVHSPRIGYFRSVINNSAASSTSTNRAMRRLLEAWDDPPAAAAAAAAAAASAAGARLLNADSASSGTAADTCTFPDLLYTPPVISNRESLSDGRTVVTLAYAPWSMRWPTFISEAHRLWWGDYKVVKVRSGSGGRIICATAVST